MSGRPVLLTGATGLLGHWLIESASPEQGLVAVTHKRQTAQIPSVAADLRDHKSVNAAVQAVRPGLVLHAAYAKDRASIVEATRNVVAAARSSNAPVVFISSDAVFLGDGIARHELSPPDAEWDYGRWKAAAEQCVVDDSHENAVIRLPLLVSEQPADPAVAKIQTGATTGLSTHWYRDETRQPAPAGEVAAAIWQIADLAESDRAGYWHLAGAESLSRFEIALRLVGRLGLASSSITSVPQPTNTGRPANIVMSDARARARINWSPSPIA